MIGDRVEYECDNSQYARVRNNALRMRVLYQCLDAHNHEYAVFVC